jgi:hypothetical protein
VTIYMAARKGASVACLEDVSVSLWRPAKLITVRFGPAPSSRDRVHDHSVWVRPRTIAISLTAVRRGGDSRARRGDRYRRGGRPSSDSCSRGGSNGGSSNHGSCRRTAVFAPIDSPANSSNARCRKGPSHPSLSRIEREWCHISQRTFKRHRHRCTDQSGTNRSE